MASVAVALNGAQRLDSALAEAEKSARALAARIADGQPLLVPRGDDGASRHTMRRVAFYGCLGMALFGYDTGVVSGALVALAEDIGLSTIEVELVVSATVAAAALGTLLGVPGNAIYGRRPVVICSSLFFAAGAGIIAAAKSFGWLMLGRFFLGLAIGLASGTVPMYTAELAPPETRGTFVVLNDLNIVAGQLVAGVTNGLLVHVCGGWRISMGLAAFPALVQFYGFLSLPESPRWLVAKGRDADAVEVLRLVRTAARVEAEIDELRESIAYEPDAGDADAAAHVCASLARIAHDLYQQLRAIWTDRVVRRAAMCGIFMMAMNQLSGINTVMYYSATILVNAGFTREVAVWLAAGCNLAQLIGVCISVYSMDRAGRRKTALRSTAGVVLTLVSMSIAFSLDGAVWAALAVASLMLYLVAFGAGLSGVPWVVNSEIFPMQVRSAAVGQATMCNWLFNWLVANTFLSLCDRLGTGGAFSLFAAFSVIGAGWLWLTLPETMGLSLEQIEDLFADENTPGVCECRPPGQGGRRKLSSQQPDDASSRSRTSGASSVPAAAPAAAAKAAGVATLSWPHSPRLRPPPGPTEPEGDS